MRLTNPSGGHDGRALIQGAGQGFEAMERVHPNLVFDLPRSRDASVPNTAALVSSGVSSLTAARKRLCGPVYAGDIRPPVATEDGDLWSNPAIVAMSPSGPGASPTAMDVGLSISAMPC